MASVSFEPALTCVLRHEGGYSDHPNDPGGATMMGITQKTLSDWRGQGVTKAEVRALARPEVAAIYRARYWNAVRADDLPAGLDLAVFDFAVNSGPLRAIRMLQRVLGVVVDGLIGPITLTAARACPVAETITQLCNARLDFLRGLSTFPVFGRGWTRRIRDVEATARRMTLSDVALRQADPLFPNPKQEIAPMEMAKTFFSSRTIWANVIGMIALALSWFGFDTSTVDKAAVTDNILQAVAALSFVASTVFRVVASKRLI
ncbi:MAG: hypothetical protein FD175_2544 [Beijerinckiaceae bacterium]|nr:MAG: hypothetical protein FD175_2544 [Beijerinckiaceae bacterium]